MTKEDLIKRLEKIQDEPQELQHILADKAIVEFLETYAEEAAPLYAKLVF